MNEPSKGRRLAGRIYLGAAAPVALIGLAPAATGDLLLAYRDSLVRLAQPNDAALIALVVVGALFGLAASLVPLVVTRVQLGGSRRGVLGLVLAGTVVGLLCAWAMWRLWPAAIADSLDVTLTMWTTSLGAYLAALTVALGRFPRQNHQTI